MERITDFSHHITRSFAKQANDVLCNPTTFDTTIDMFYPHASSRQLLIKRLLLVREPATARLFVWRSACHASECKRKEAQILQSFTPFWQRIGCCIGNSLIVGAPFIGIAQEQDSQHSVDQEHIFQ